MLEILVNAAAGSAGDDLEPRLREAFGAAGVAVEVVAVEPAGLAGEVARRADAGAEVVAVAGGDGSLVTAAGELAGRETALLPVPAGTLNHFARRLGIPDFETAAATAVGGRRVRVPLGAVGERVFLNTATFGLYADVVRRRDRSRLPKWPAAALAIGWRLARLRRLAVTLEAAGERRRYRTPLVWIGLGWGSFPLPHEAPLEEWPDLEVAVLEPRNRAALLALFGRLFVHLLRRERPEPVDATVRGRGERRSLDLWHTDRLHLDAGGPIGVTLDGEVLRLEPPVEVTLHADPLTVLAPEDPPRPAP